MSDRRPSLTSERWREVRRVFAEAADRAGPEREAYLRSTCGSRSWLRDEVDSLLAAHAGGPLPPDPTAEECAPASFLPDAAPGEDPVFDLLRLEIGHRYEMEERLGSGGMGAVYSARDPKHGRRVAIKVLHPWLAPAQGGKRFRREILITAGLQHPHIVPLIDSGVAEGLHFYVMPYLQGETLRHYLERERRLPADRVVDIGLDVLGALEHAHAAGVVHRDIKPENILLAADQALVFDFGIAAGVFPDDSAVGELTESGLLLGTPRYMAPEQADEPPGPDSDLFALGAVLFEAASGRRWRMGATAEKVDWTDVPPALRPVLQRALRADPVRRWPDAASFREALEGAAHQKRSAIAGVRPTLRAASTAAAVVLAVGIGAGWLLWSGGESGAPPPAGEARPSTSVAAVPGGAPAVRAGAPAPGVYDHYLRAREELREARYGSRGDTREHAVRARHHLQFAIEADPTFAPAWATLSEAFALRVFTDGGEWVDSALAAGRHALRVDPAMAEGHVAVGYALHWQGDQLRALSHLEEALAMNPASAQVHVLAAAVLHATGRWDEALTHALRAASLEPTEEAHMETVGRIHLDLALHDDALVWLRHRLEREPENASSRAWIAYLHMLRGEDGRAEAVLDTALALAPSSVRALQMSYLLALRRGDPRAAEGHARALMAELSDQFRPLVTLGCALWRSGDRDAAEALFRRADERARDGMRGRRPLARDALLDLARIQSIRGDSRSALRWLRAAVDEGWTDYQYVRLDPRFSDLRREPEFWELVARMRERVAAMREGVAGGERAVSDPGT